MPSLIAHSAAGLMVGWLHPAGSSRRRLAGRAGNLALVLLLANVPDLDFVLQIALGGRIHHTFSHSIVFGLVFSAVLAALWVMIRHGSFGLTFSLIGMVYGSHVLLDMLGGGPGVQLLWPFSVDYVRIPWEVFPPVHYTRGLLDPSHATFIVFELVFSAAVLGVTLALKSRWARRTMVQAPGTAAEGDRR